MCVCEKIVDDSFIIPLSYDDVKLIIGHDTEKDKKVKQRVSKSISMKDLGFAQQIFGMIISYDRRVIKCGCLNLIKL